MVRRLLLGFLVMVAVGVAGPGAAQAAQQASPTNAQPGPLCDVTPQSVDALVALAFPSGTPAASSTNPAPMATESELPQGSPADADTAAAVEQVVQSWLVCSLAGDGARLFALMTDDLDATFLQQYIVLPAGDTPGELRGLLESDLGATLIVGSTRALATLGRELRVLADGRVGGIWTVDGNDVFFILEQQGGRWLIDEVIDLLEQATPPP